MKFLQQLQWPIIIALCLFLGLAPFNPPHLVEKIGMLKNGTLTKPLDWFDLAYHASPFLLALAKLIWGRGQDLDHGH